MHLPLKLLVGAFLMSLVTLRNVKPDDVGRSRTAYGCANTTPDDSIDVLKSIRFVVAGPIEALRTHSDLPNLPEDSVQYAGSSAQCDSVSARYKVVSPLPVDSVPVLLLRVGPTRWVADPKVLDETMAREWIILDSTLQIIKIWKTQ